MHFVVNSVTTIIIHNSFIDFSFTLTIQLLLLECSFPYLLLFLLKDSNIFYLFNIYRSCIQ